MTWPLAEVIGLLGLLALGVVILRYARRSLKHGGSLN